MLGESIGDLAGAKIAYRAYLKSREGKGPEPTVDGFTPEQQFFVGWGQFRGDAIRSETQRLMVQNDPHPTGKYRVIGPLTNMPEFARAFALRRRRTDGAPGGAALRGLVGPVSPGRSNVCSSTGTGMHCGAGIAERADAQPPAGGARHRVGTRR